ncbi:uncharacterized protein LOC124279651 [Haliotis rubra]|uniref:uncharacterized protein LOC124279651 n=1 Tax=Haliotis rubra TaxID=36100 RepID=UPI001EE50394|nr:uncharacterized protein LOC124279651 [Haliotis rubra]
MRLTFHLLIILSVDLHHFRLQLSEASVQHLKFAHLGDYKDKIRTSRIIKNGSTRSMVHCAQLCSEIEACVSFFHNKNTRHCSLHDVIFFSPDDGTDSPGMKYYVYDEGDCSFREGFIYSRISKACFSIRSNDGLNNWASSKSFCKLRNFRLATVDSKEKYDYTVATIKQSSRFKGYANYYIGLNDHAKEGKFVWVDGTPAQWTKWEKGRPLKDVKRNCVILAGSRTYNGVFSFVDKRGLDAAFRWICEKVLP